MKRIRPQHGRGSTASTLQEWVKLAIPEVVGLIDSQMAVPAPELLARLSEQGVRRGGAVLQLDPHVLTEATTQLRGLGVIGEWAHPTKGGSTVPLWVPGDWTGRATYIQRAIRRKGMLYARYRRLADNYMGDAGEAILRRSLTEAGNHLSPTHGDFDPAHQLLGVQLFGPLDSGAYLVCLDKSTAPAVYTVPIEMKNRRLTIYPTHKEIHQLLAKAAALQIARPDQQIVPVLVCRRAHARLFWMAKDLGFLVHATNRQYTTLPKGSKPIQLDQIRNELGLLDLTLVNDKTPLIRQFLRETLPGRAEATAQRWKLTAPHVQPYADALRVEGPSSTERLDLVRELRQVMEEVFADAGINPGDMAWSLPDLLEEDA